MESDWYYVTYRVVYFDGLGRMISAWRLCEGRFPSFADANRYGTDMMKTSQIAVETKILTETEVNAMLRCTTG